MAYHLYCRFLGHCGVHTLMIGAELAGAYTFLYIILRPPDYALRMGMIALFVALAALMSVMGRVDRYARFTFLKAHPKRRCT